MGELDATDHMPQPRHWVDHAPREHWRLPRKGHRGMRLAGRVTAVTTATITMAVLVACTGSPNEAPTPSVTPTPSMSSQPPTPPSPSPSPTPPSQAEVAAAQAESLVREYYVLREALRVDTSVPLDRLEDFTISTELASQQRLIQGERDRGEHQTGSTRIVELDVTDVNLDNSDPSAGRVPVVEIELCVDVSGVDFIDASGNSVVVPGRPDAGWVRHQVANYAWDTDPANGWRISSSETIERQPCDITR